MGMKKYSLLLILCMLAPLASADNSYTGYNTTSIFFSCVQPNFNNVTGEVGMHAVVDMDFERSPTYRDCPAGERFVIPFNRAIWIQDRHLNPIGQVALPKPSMSDSYGMIFSNEFLWKSLYVGKDGKDISKPQDSVKVKPSLTGSALSNINSHLKYDISTSTPIESEIMWYYYALAYEDINDFSPTNWASTSAQSNSFFHRYRVPTSVSDSTLFTLGIGGYAQSPGHLCGNSTTRCVSESQLDVDVNMVQSPIFAFTDNIDYYYYPYYIEDVLINVFGYNQSTPGKNTIFTESKRVKPTSNAIYFRPGADRQWEIFQDLGIGPQFPIKIVDVPNLGTQVKYDGTITKVPTNVKYVEVYTTITLRPNLFYRYKSPVDFSDNDYWVRSCSVLSLSSLCDSDRFESVRVFTSQHWDFVTSNGTQRTMHSAA